MQLPELPTEILLQIAKDLKSERCISALARSSCRHYEVVNSYLYRRNLLESGGSGLLWTAEHGSEDTAANFLVVGANATHHNIWALSLLVASANEREAVAKLLRSEAGVDPDFRDVCSRTSLSMAAAGGSVC